MSGSRVTEIPTVVSDRNAPAGNVTRANPGLSRVPPLGGMTPDTGAGSWLPLLTTNARRSWKRCDGSSWPVIHTCRVLLCGVLSVRIRMPSASVSAADAVSAPTVNRDVTSLPLSSAAKLPARIAVVNRTLTGTGVDPRVWSSWGERTSMPLGGPAGVAAAPAVLGIPTRVAPAIARPSRVCMSFSGLPPADVATVMKFLLSLCTPDHSGQRYRTYRDSKIALTRPRETD